MKKYRKKPVVVEAEQWLCRGDLPGVVINYTDAAQNSGCSISGHCKNCTEKQNHMALHGWIETLEGGYIVCPGDWIIKVVEGEFCLCKPDIFEATYEEVTDAPKCYPVN